jgi:hypothetical protein
MRVFAEILMLNGFSESTINHNSMCFKESKTTWKPHAHPKKKLLATSLAPT